MGDFLNLMAFFGDFFVAFPATLQLTLYFWYMKGDQVVHVSIKCHSRPTFSSQVFKFEMSS